MGDAEERLVWGTNGGDGRQTPPGQLGVSPGGDEDEAGAAVSGGACEGEEPRAPPKVVGEEEEEEELDPRIQVRSGCKKGLFPGSPCFFGGDGVTTDLGVAFLFPHPLFGFSLPQEELEHLNQANEEINRVELQLDVSFSPSP